MHISSTYTGRQNVSDLTGEISLPALQSDPDLATDTKFEREINREGVYIHKLSTDQDSLTEQFIKIKEHRIPTPCTFVGAGLHQIYNHWRWKNSSGLVFRPDTPSMLSYKGDIQSARLSSHSTTLANCSTGTKKAQLEAFSRNRKFSS